MDLLENQCALLVFESAYLLTKLDDFFGHLLEVRFQLFEVKG